MICPRGVKDQHKKNENQGFSFKMGLWVCVEFRQYVSWVKISRTECTKPSQVSAYLPFAVVSLMFVYELF